MTVFQASSGTPSSSSSSKGLYDKSCLPDGTRGRSDIPCHSCCGGCMNRLVCLHMTGHQQLSVNSSDVLAGATLPVSCALCHMLPYTLVRHSAAATLPIQLLSWQPCSMDLLNCHWHAGEPRNPHELGKLLFRSCSCTTVSAFEGTPHPQHHAFLLWS